MESRDAILLIRQIACQASNFPEVKYSFFDFRKDCSDQVIGIIILLVKNILRTPMRDCASY